MGRLSAAAAVALGLAELATCSSCSTCPAPHVHASAPLAAGTADAPQDVSIIALIAQPELFRDHWVQLVGYLVVEFEGNAIYLDETAFVHNVAKNALALDFEDASATSPARGTRGYFIVSGKFVPELHGHPGLFSGALTQLHRISPFQHAIYSYLGTPRGRILRFTPIDLLSQPEQKQYPMGKTDTLRGPGTECK